MDNLDPDLDHTQKELSSLEERKFAKESELRAKELALREREVAAKEAELRRSRWSNPTVIGLFAAAIALVGSLIVALINNRSSQEIERSRVQSTLIVQAVSTGDAHKACTNLISFIRLGLLDDPKGTMSRCESAPGNIPVLPGTTYTPISDTPWADQMSPSVTRVDEGSSYRFNVSFTVPANPPNPSFKFDLITVYAYRFDSQDNRSNDMSLPELDGTWKPGSRVTFSATLPKSYVDDPAHTVYLRFCVGSKDGCLPGPNLLLPRPQ